MTDLLHCSDVVEKLPLYVGGDLEPEGLEAVRGHLADCERCVEELQVVSRARRALVAALRVEEDSTAHDDGGLDLWPGIRAALVRDGRLEPRTQRPKPVSLSAFSDEPATSSTGTPWVRRLPRFAAAAAAVVVLAWGASRLVGSGAPQLGPGAADPSRLAGSPVATVAPVGLGAPEIAGVERPSAHESFVTNEPTGGLRRVQPGEESLADSAESLGQLHFAEFPPTPASAPLGVPVRPWLNPTTVAGYR